MNCYFCAMHAPTHLPAAGSPNPAPAVSRREAGADAAVHSLGIAFALLAPVVLARLPGTGATLPHLLAATIYATSLLTMILCSALYHLTRHPAAKRLFQVLDHAAIFLMIAGTYTPFCLLGLRGAAGTALLGCVWLVAIIGIVLRLGAPQRFERWSVGLYLLLGWSGIVALPLLLLRLHTGVLMLLGLGGAIYSLGVVVHLAEKLRYRNALWHGFVLGAAICHFIAVAQLVGTA